MLSKFLGVPLQIEVTLITLLGICILYFDTSVSQFDSNLEEVWNYTFHEKVRGQHDEIYLKYILAGVIVLRTFTSHVFLALYIVLLWPVIYKEKPNSILPWLIIGFVRSIFLNLVTLTTGCYVCWIQKGYDVICIDLVLAQILEHGPSIYAWLSIYRNVITESTITNLINHLRKIKPLLSPSRSLDALLEGKSSFKLLKMDSYVNDQRKSIPERVMCLLNVVYDDIKRAKMEQEERSSWILNELKLDNISNKGMSYDFRTSCSLKKNVSVTLFGVKNNENDKNISSDSAHDDALKEGSTNEIELKCVSLDSTTCCSKTVDIPNTIRNDDLSINVEKIE